MIARNCATTLKLGMPSCMVRLVGIYLLTSNQVFFFFVNVIMLDIHKSALKARLIVFDFLVRE
jgi:hypothetical protein